MTDPDDGPRIAFVTEEHAANTWCPAGRPLPSGATLRCRLAPGHDGLHDDGTGTWTDPPTPQQTLNALRAAGFTVTGGRAGVYARLDWPEHVTGGTVMVSLDPDAPEHAAEMDALRHVLEDAAARGDVARRALEGLADPAALAARLAAAEEPPW